MIEFDALKQIAPKIKKIREIKGFSQDYVASKLNITQNSFSKIERGETKITLEKLSEICKILEIDLNMLLNFDEKMVFNHCNQTGNFGENNTFVFNTLEKIQELYERIIASKDKEIYELKIKLKQS